MRSMLLTFALALAACAHEPPAEPTSAPVTATRDGPAEIELDGEVVEVRWSDGDSFELRSGRHAGKDTRLVGYNTLESYGPVHRWGDWSAAELYEIARSSKHLAGSKRWRCTTDGKLDSYKRLLVTCPDASRALIEAGHAFVMAVDDTPDPELLEAQRRARAARVGIWAKGTPDEIVTSVHPAEPGRPGYNRVVSLETGRSRKWQHEERYEECAEVCVPGGGACLVYVAFDRRYKPSNKAPCLR